MRPLLFLLAAPVAALLTASTALAQAGRFIPVPRNIPIRNIPIRPGGYHFPIHIPWFGRTNVDLFWVIVAVIAVIVLAVVVGMLMSRARSRRSAADQPLFAPAPPDPFEENDLILSPAQVADKARQTTCLLDVLARRDGLFNRSALHGCVTATFTQVQRSWQERDYAAVDDLLLPSLRARHEAMLQAMRRQQLVNRLDGLAIHRLEFVHVSCPEQVDRHEVTALITFGAHSFLANDTSGALVRGTQAPRQFQEFWVFRRQGEAWRLDAIERSHESTRLAAPNAVAGMSEAELRNIQDNVILL
jgi:predicted lipid-binding transport protein (Tim44 family)